MKISFSSDDRAVDFGTDDTWCVPSLRPCNDGIGGLLVRLFRGVGWNLELGSNLLYQRQTLYQLSLYESLQPGGLSLYYEFYPQLVFNSTNVPKIRKGKINSDG
jgi:hypothetical protein